VCSSSALLARPLTALHWRPPPPNLDESYSCDIRCFQVSSGVRPLVPILPFLQLIFTLNASVTSITPSADGGSIAAKTAHPSRMRNRLASSLGAAPLEAGNFSGRPVQDAVDQRSARPGPACLRHGGLAACCKHASCQHVFRPGQHGKNGAGHRRNVIDGVLTTRHAGIMPVRGLGCGPAIVNRGTRSDVR
jgi:hypothetical protein